MGTWLNLSKNLFYFGNGGINRVEPNIDYTLAGKPSIYKSRLFEGQRQITVVEETVEQIKELLKDE